jgi:hypothetical protein
LTAIKLIGKRRVRSQPMAKLETRGEVKTALTGHYVKKMLGELEDTRDLFELMIS